MSVDLQRGILFIPLTSPATDLYGGDRKGAGLFGDSLVALDAATGKRLWHFQTVHHNLWDYDLPAQPVLVQVHKNGKLIDAVAQVTKTGYTFIFDRVTGDPVFPIEEVKVAPSEVPGESAWATQPRPVKPPPYARQSMTADELGDVRPETRAYCSKLIQDAVFGSLFTPIGFKPTVLFPGTNGGANWGGASFDPETHTLYVNSMDVGMLFRMTKRGEGAEIPYRPQGLGSPNSRFWDPDLIPCQRPPWGFLTAINLDEGNFRWRSVLGVVDKLAGKGLPPTGAPNIGGTLVTAGGLVFIGATNDSRFRAFDKETGKELWTTELPASAHATPMTFRGAKSGRQFVVVAAGGGNKYNSTYSDSLIAFALPGGGSDAPLISKSRETSKGPNRDAATKVQPEAERSDEVFSHPTHEAAEFRCTRCHATALTGAKAGFPTGKACLPCHKGVQSTPILPPNPAVYRLPDFVFFRHSRHAGKGITCDSCHGNVWSQDPVVQVLPMKMKACIDCHQANHAPVTCTTCHELSQ
jgi:quinoprotein glucose dehydrogenase